MASLLFSDLSVITGCLSPGKGSFTIQLGHMWALVDCYIIHYDQSLFFLCHCQSVAPCSQTLLAATISQVNQKDALPPSNASVLSCVHLVFTPTLHLQFKTRQHLCRFASTVLSNIKPCIMPPFDSDAFIIGVDNQSSRCMDSNINHFTNVQWPKMWH